MPTFQNRTVRIIAGVKSRNSRTNLIMRVDVLTLPSKYTFILMNFDVNNQQLFQPNSAACKYAIKTVVISTFNFPYKFPRS